jgi:tetratricopeptide (TPR) repeat protein
MSVLELESLNEAIRRTPRLGAAYRRRGAYYRFEGMYKEAAADYAKALDLDPRDLASASELALCRAYLGG